MTVREMRLAASMTQRAYAEYFGVSIRTVESWEYGRVKCPEHLRSLMEYKLRNEGIIKNTPEE